MIHRLRSRPEGARIQLLYIMTIISLVILLALWFYSLGKSLGSPSNGTDISENLRPLSDLKTSAIDGYNNILKPGINSTEESN